MAGVEGLQEVVLLLPMGGQLHPAAEALAAERAEERGRLREAGDDPNTGRGAVVPLLAQITQGDPQRVLRDLGRFAELFVLLAVVEEESRVQEALAAHRAAVQSLLEAVLGLAVGHQFRHQPEARSAVHAQEDGLGLRFLVGSSFPLRRILCDCGWTGHLRKQFWALW